MPTPTHKTPSDVLTRNTEDFGQFSVSDPAVIKDLGSVNVESRGMVFPMMSGLLQDGEIGKSVIRFFPVDVMYMLGGPKLASEMFLHNPTMLVDLLPIHANDLVPSRIQAIDELASDVATATAKRPLIWSQSASLLNETLAARIACKGDFHVPGEIPCPSKSINQ